MERKKKQVYFAVLFLILSVNFLSFASAEDGGHLYSSSPYGSYSSSGFDLREGSEQVIELVVDFAEPFLQVLLGGEDYSGLLLFGRVLIFILLLSIVYLSISNIPAFEDMKAVTWVVAIIIPLIAVRFINYEWLNTILISYQVLGIAILGILPFIIYMFFLHGVTESTTARKIGWIFFVVVYFGLWSTNKQDNYSQIYFWTMLVALVFLLFDGTIHRAFEQQKWKEAGKSAVYESIIKLNKRLQEAREVQGIDRKVRAKMIKDLLKQRRELYKQL